MTDRKTRDKMHFLDKYGTESHKEKSNAYFGDIAKSPAVRTNMSLLADLPMKHLKTAALEHPDQFVRQMAFNTYHNKKRAGYPE